MSTSTPSTSAGSSHQDLKECEQILLGLTSMTSQCAMTLKDWDTSKQLFFRSTVDNIIAELGHLKHVASTMDPSYTVPFEVMGRVDEGVNPDTFTRNYLDEVRTRNDHVRGRKLRTEVLLDSFATQLNAWDPAIATGAVGGITAFDNAGSSSAGAAHTTGS